MKLTILLLAFVPLYIAGPLSKPRYFLHMQDFISDHIETVVEHTENLKKEIIQELETLQSQTNKPENTQKKSILTDFDEDDELSTLYYWFALHDLNDDGKLDGYELLQAFSQWGVAQEEHRVEKLDDIDGRKSIKIFSSMTTMVDTTLEEDDRNNDGVVDVEEFLASQFY